MTSSGQTVRAYQQCRERLVAAQGRSTSRALAAELARAIQLADASVATVHDLGQLLAQALTHTQAVVDARQAEALAAIARVDAAAEAALAADTDADAALPLLQGAIDGLAAHGAQTAGMLALARLALVRFLAQYWLGVLDGLYRHDSRAVFFARLEKLAVFLAGKLPGGIGSALEALHAVVEAATIREQQRRGADDYLHGLESFGDAAEACVEGVLGLCEAMQRLMVDQPAATVAQVQARVARHRQALAAGTHPLSAPPPPA